MILPGSDLRRWRSSRAIRDRRAAAWRVSSAAGSVSRTPPPKGEGRGDLSCCREDKDGGRKSKSHAREDAPAEKLRLLWEERMGGLCHSMLVNTQVGTEWRWDFENMQRDGLETFLLQMCTLSQRPEEAIPVPPHAEEKELLLLLLCCPAICFFGTQPQGASCIASLTPVVKSRT